VYGLILEDVIVDFTDISRDFYLDVLYGLVEEGCPNEEIVFELRKSEFGRSRTEFQVLSDVREARKIIMK
jgi:hypothetical protein